MTTTKDRFAILADRLIDGIAPEPMVGKGVLVEDGRIAGLAATEEIDRLGKEGWTVVRRPGCTLLPGLIDGHVHLNFSCSENPLNELLMESEAQLLLRAVSNAQTALFAGITTLRDCASKGTTVIALRDAIRAGLVLGPRLVVSGMPITCTGGHCHFLGQEVDSEEEVLAATRQLFKEGADFIKVMASGGNMTPGSNSRLRQFSAEHIRIVTEQARQRNRHTAAHVHSTVSIEDCLDAGIDTFEHCSWQADGSGTDYREDLVDRLLEQGAYVCPAFGMNYLMPPEQGAPLPEKAAMWKAFLDSRFDTLSRMFKRGVKMFAGTDAGVKLTPFDSLPSIMAEMQRRIGMTNMQVIQSATAISAEAIGVAGDTGAIEAGRQADLVVVAGDPLADIGALKAVRDVFLDGRSIKGLAEVGQAAA